MLILRTLTLVIYLCDKEKDNNEKQPIDNDNINSMATPQMPDMSGSDIQCITIIGQVEGHSILSNQTKATKYEHILPLLVAMEESSDVKGFIVLLNTMGGDVEAGLAIAEMISGMSKPSVSLVLGGGHSIGITLATSTDVSFIAPTATMMIHPVRLNGLVIGVSQTYNYLRRMQDRVIAFVTRHSRMDRETLLKLMLETDELANDVGKIVIGQEAVDCGLIDHVGSISDALSELRKRISEAEEAS